jgi:molybdate transport system substrate-binding protein
MTLESRGLVKAGNRLTYATGRLVLWQPGGLQDGSIKTSLLGSYRKLAIANPALAPYGRAAIEVLDSLQIRTLVEDKLVQGENIEQAYQFVASGNAELGLMAFSQMDRSDPQSFILIPANLHRPIYQQMVLLSEKVAAADFFRYLQRPQTQRLIRQAGYDTDDE